MSRSAFGGSIAPFHTASGFTRVLVLNASETCEAMSDSRPGWTWPKPSARASGLAITSAMAMRKRRLSRSRLAMPSRCLIVSTAASGLAMASLAPRAKAVRKAFTAAGFSRTSLGEAMITLPYSFTPCSE